jgi:plasmid maintenance system killer protein
VDIQFEDKDLSNPKKRKGKFQHVQPQLERRLSELESANTLDEYAQTYPGAYLHERSGDQKGIFTVKLTGNYRLCFQPFLQEGEDVADNKSIKSIKILRIDDPH